MNTIFADFGSEEISSSSHLEKLCLVKDGVGRNSIRDFTTNLIKEFLLTYTERFAKKHIDLQPSKEIPVTKVQFNYTTKTWTTRTFDLPFYFGNYVLLTPKDILTHDDTWINRQDLINPDVFEEIASALPNEQLRAQVNQYLVRALTRFEDKPTKKDKQEAIREVISKYPELIDYYIRFKEATGNEAITLSQEQVQTIKTIFVEHVESFVEKLNQSTRFYAIPADTYANFGNNFMFLKDVIENKGGHRIFYNGVEPIKREQDLQILFRLVWFGTPSDVSREVNDGRGPADFKISRGSSDKSLAEFKLASNSQLKRNLEKQTLIYQKASDASHTIKVILYFSQRELKQSKTSWKISNYPLIPILFS